MLITSLNNATVKLLASLRLDKYRKESGLFLVEGQRTITEAFAAGATPSILAYTSDDPDLEPLKHRCAESGGNVIAVTREVMAKITHKDNPQNIAAAFPTKLRPMSDIAPKQNEIYIALDRIRDPGNLGAIIRTAHAVGAAGLVLIGASCDPYATESVRATTGSIFHVPLYAGDEAAFLELAQTWPGSVVGSAANAPAHYRETEYRTPVVAVMGTEQSGLSPAIAAACRHQVHIPMYGGAESLNVSVATGILLYGIRDALDGESGTIVARN